MKHSICRWTFNPGKGGFVPADMRPEWKGMTSADFVELVAGRIRRRIPRGIELGVELHYDGEVDESSAPAVAAALRKHKISLGLITPGAHAHWAYGGVASPDPNERAAAAAFALRTVDLAYGPLRRAWHPKAPPTFVLWNGSWGYDIPGPWLYDMLGHLERAVLDLLRYEKRKGGKLFIAIEPKPNEGHPKMILPTVASALLLRRRLGDRGADVARVGTNKEFGHSEMIGLDPVYDTAEELREKALVHVHANSQGYDGIRQGGPGMFDVDHGVAITAPNLAIARLLLDARYDRWIGHDMQPRAYDNVDQAVDRVVRSVINWEAMVAVARKLDLPRLMKLLAARQTAGVEDLLADAITAARRLARKMHAS